MSDEVLEFFKGDTEKEAWLAERGYPSVRDCKWCQKVRGADFWVCVLPDSHDDAVTPDYLPGFFLDGAPLECLCGGDGYDSG